MSIESRRRNFTRPPEAREAARVIHGFIYCAAPTDARPSHSHTSPCISDHCLQRPQAVASGADWPWSSWQHPFYVLPPPRRLKGTSAESTLSPPHHHVFRIPRWTCDGAHLIEPYLIRKELDDDGPFAEHVFLDGERSSFVNCSSPPRVQRRRYGELARSICWNKSKPSQEPGALSMMSVWPINCRIQSSHAEWPFRPRGIPKLPSL